MRQLTILAACFLLVFSSACQKKDDESATEKSAGKQEVTGPAARNEEALPNDETEQPDSPTTNAGGALDAASDGASGTATGASDTSSGEAARPATCEVIFERAWQQTQTYVALLGLTPDDAKASVREANAKGFFEPCDQLTDVERMCLAAAKFPLAAFETCNLKDKLSFEFPLDAISLFDKMPIDDDAELLEKTVGTWARDNPNQPGAKERFTIEPSRKATQVNESPSREPSTKSWQAWEFPKKRSAGLPLAAAAAAAGIGGEDDSGNLGSSE